MNEWHPDWDQVEPLKEALREYMAEVQRLRAAMEQVECMCGICKLKPVSREPVAWRKHYGNSGYTYFDKRWGTIPDGAEPLFSD